MVVIEPFFKGVAEWKSSVSYCLGLRFCLSYISKIVWILNNNKNNVGSMTSWTGIRLPWNIGLKKEVEFEFLNGVHVGCQ